MGTKSRRKKERKIRKNEIIDAAEELFFSQGFAETTMSEVADKAEFSKRTLYVYFDSKRQLYLAIMLRGFNKLITLYKQKIETDREKTGLEKIKALGSIFIELNSKYPNYFTAIANYQNQEVDFQSEDEINIECYQKGEEIFTFLIEALKDGIEDGSIHQDININSTAVVLWANIMGVANLITRKEKYLQHYQNQEPEDVIEETFTFVERSLIRGEE